ncbi:LAME_0C06810g1_1 [Lachancea meyersii CBS 8951]|uniref:LAME_0C06810g1_1 n=1 Tax=Lachancea meyersii CBS 8951 TaxID=1266667 RepID=A0A1G4J2F7_9SACH|nr:LAME_0C06810g1_1 [Lachancea meyersii CBS 8951]
MFVDRHVKLLSRQRGSALRKVEQDVVISQIKKPRLDRPSYSSPSKDVKQSPESEPSFDVPQSPPEFHVSQDSNEPASTPPRSPVLNGGLLTSPDNPFTSPVPDQASAGQNSPVSPARNAETPILRTKDSPSLSPEPEFDFSDLPISQLRSNAISLAGIEVVWSILSNLFEEQLIPQAYADFDTATDATEQLMHKLDIKLLSTFMRGVLSDLQDTIDINSSNNELCSQLKECAKQKVKLSENLVDIRHQIIEWENREADDEQLEELQLKSALNDKLQNLAISVSTKAEHDDNHNDKDEMPSLEPTANDLVELLDPQDGILGRLQTLNRSLEKLLE